MQGKINTEQSAEHEKVKERSRHCRLLAYGKMAGIVKENTVSKEQMGEGEN